MDKKQLEALKSAIAVRVESLNKDKTGLETEIEKEQNRSIEKTYIQVEFETDLAKVQKELSMVGGDDEQLKALIDRENEETSNIEKAQLAIDSLNKDKQALEAEINKLQGTYELEDGKFKKTYILESFESELAKVMAELEQKEQAISASQADLGKVEEEFKALTTKYNIKEIEPEAEVEQQVDMAEKQAQEEQMWQEYEKENAYNQESVDADINKAYAEKEAQEQAEQRELEEQEKLERQLEQEQQDKLAQQAKQEQQSRPAGSATAAFQRPITRPQTARAAVEEQTPAQEKTANSSKPWEISDILFYIKDGNVPCYKICLESENATLEKEFEGEEYLKTLNASEAYRLNIKEHIYGAEKYYDNGLATLLEEIDKDYGTSSLEKYKKQIKSREIISANFDKYSDELLDIDYDFSELYDKPSTKESRVAIKKLKKIANANYKKGLAGYEKAPNFLQKLWRKITTKQIAAGTVANEKNHTSEEKSNVKKQYSQQVREARMEQEKAPTTRETVLKNYMAMHDEEGFDIDAFVEGLPKEDAEMYRDMQQKYEQTKKKSNSFKENLAEAARKVDGNRANNEPVKSAKQNENNPHEEKEPAED